MLRNAKQCDRDENIWEKYEEKVSTENMNFDSKTLKKLWKLWKKLN